MWFRRSSSPLPRLRSPTNQALRSDPVFDSAMHNSPSCTRTARAAVRSSFLNKQEYVLRVYMSPLGRKGKAGFPRH